MRLLARCIGHAAAFRDQTAEVGPILAAATWTQGFRTTFFAADDADNADT